MERQSEKYKRRNQGDDKRRNRKIVWRNPFYFYG